MDGGSAFCVCVAKHINSKSVILTGVHFYVGKVYSGANAEPETGPISLDMFFNARTRSGSAVSNKFRDFDNFRKAMPPDH